MTTYYNPVRVEFGRGSIDFINRYVQKEKVLLLTSPTFIKNGTVEKLQKLINVEQVISHIKPNPTIEDVLEIRSNINYGAFDKIIALGGGSVIDTAKAVSPYSLSNDIDFVELLKHGFNNISCEFKKIIAIPTTAGTGSEVTKWGTIWDVQNKLKYSISDDKLYCEVAILDSNLHTTLPLDLTIQTGLDALSHSLEALWNKNANEISDAYAISAIKSIITILPKLVNNLEDVSLREEMLLASYRAGLAFSNTQTALAHAMSYYMTLNKNVPHGIAASFTLPIIAEVALNNPNLKGKLQLALGENPISTLKNLLKDLNISTDSLTYQIFSEDWLQILKTLKNTPRANNSLVNAEQVISLMMK